nr:MAG TPA: hypothetical protein [Caudoviricetes sp.]
MVRVVGVKKNTGKAYSNPPPINLSVSSIVQAPFKRCRVSDRSPCRVQIPAVAFGHYPQLWRFIVHLLRAVSNLCPSPL